ncbi:MAG: hypothetical protein H6R42_415, partial [Nitrospirae bacterium]|nr:hypothetical protein [Nitrospirota bacterium]
IRQNKSQNIEDSSEDVWQQFTDKNEEKPTEKEDRVM